MYRIMFVILLFSTLQLKSEKTNIKTNIVFKSILLYQNSKIVVRIGEIILYFNMIRRLEVHFGQKLGPVEFKLGCSDTILKSVFHCTKISKL